LTVLLFLKNDQVCKTIFLRQILVYASFYLSILVCQTSNFYYLNHALIYSRNRPVPFRICHEGKVLCSRKQRKLLTGFKLKT